MRLPLCTTLAALVLVGCAHGRIAPAAEPDPANPAAAAANKADVQVRKVVLFSSGVGYFEHEGTVAGNAATELRFKTGQINDILKSLLLEDRDGGTVGTVDYASLDPLEKTLKSFQVDITGNPTLAQLLNQLRGAKVTVTIQTEKVVGTILGVEKRTKVIGDKNQTVETWVLNLLSVSTIRQLPLEDVQNVTLEDQALQEELTKALTALTQARDQDKKPVVIHFDGKGNRRVRLGYVVETPVWKTSYRLVMPAKAGDKGALQGWAIVENQTDNDWKDVNLSLVSGRPVSFVQDLYRPLYVPRPTVEPELFASLRPQTYSGGMDAAGADKLADRKADNGRRQLRGREEAEKSFKDATFARAATAPAGAAMDAAELEEAPSESLAMNAVASVTSAAAAEKLGELFQYSVPNVTLQRQRSAMLPIVTDPVQVEKVSIFNLNVLASHPLNGAIITNTTGKHLLQGPMTVLDGGGYAGDATIDNVPPGDHRLISFAIDIPVRVDATSHHDESRVVSGRIVNGILVLTNKLVGTQEYQIDNTSEDAKTIIVEHPFRQGWKLTDGAEPFEKTPALYRYKVPVAAKKSAKHVVTEEYIQTQSLAIIDLDFPAIEFYIKTGTIPQKVKDALAKAAKIKGEMAETQRASDARQNEINAIGVDQNRLRENMRTVQNQQSQYYQRLLTKLNDQETQVEAKQVELEKLRTTLEAKRKELTDYLANLQVE
ncbi:MAG: hypothetical protein H0W83_15455 [Planctomycetes bacterium]|nr:hypothetical protein [Planctomycetota bacterium]